jgi:hypothetical protein
MLSMSLPKNTAQEVPWFCLDELCRAEAVKGVMEFVCTVESVMIANTNGLEFSEVIFLC